jgi:hypothetical protein
MQDIGAATGRRPHQTGAVEVDLEAVLAAHSAEFVHEGERKNLATAGCWTGSIVHAVSVLHFSALNRVRGWLSAPLCVFSTQTTFSLLKCGSFGRHHCCTAPCSQRSNECPSHSVQHALSRPPHQVERAVGQVRHKPGEGVRHSGDAALLVEGNVGTVAQERLRARRCVELRAVAAVGGEACLAAALRAVNAERDEVRHGSCGHEQRRILAQQARGLTGR